jgi:hypothetical protein
LRSIRKGLGKLEHLYEDLGRSLGIHRWAAPFETQLEPPGGRETSERIRSRLACALHIRVDH